jgi:hypothetical protein
LSTLLDGIEVDHRGFFFGLIGHTQYPYVELLEFKEMQTGLIEYMLQSKVPQPYAQLVASMLKSDLEERISIQEALQILRTNLSINTLQNSRATL